MRCVMRRAPEDDPAEFAQVIDINLNGTMHMCAAARPLSRVDRGSILNTASMLSFFGGGLVPAYSASKGGGSLAINKRFLRYLYSMIFRICKIEVESNEQVYDPPGKEAVSHRCYATHA